MTITLTIATKNESENIQRCIKSVPFVDEIVVVDDCSSDDTVRKAIDLGAKVITRESKGSFHENKNLAIREAKGDWILSLDADEVVTEELALSISEALLNPGFEGYLIDRHNFFLGQWIKGCGWYPDYILRLFRKGKAWWPLEIHDVPRLEQGNANAGILKGPLIHYSYKDLDQYFDKFNKYTSRLAVEYAQKQEPISGPNLPLNLFFRPLYWFCKKYFVNRGYKDGLPGFFISFSSALTIFVSYLKLRYAQRIRAGE